MSIENNKLMNLADGQLLYNDLRKRKADMIFASASGSIASFSDGADNQPMRSVVSQIVPVQDLHGQDAPYPAGGGKNLLPMTLANVKSLNTSGTWNDNVYIENSVSFTCATNTEGAITSITVNGTASANTFLNIVSGALSTFLANGSIYAINGCPSGGGTGASGTYELQVRIGTSAYRDDTGSGTTLTFDSSADNSSSKVRIVIYSGTNVSNKVYYPMIRLSSITDATFAPYSNLCPISGWTGMNVSRTGKNLLDRDSSTKNYYINASGTPTSSNDFEYSELIPVDKQKLYIEFETTETTSRYYRLHGYNSAGTWVEQIDAHQITASGSYKYDVSVPSEIKYVRFSYSKVATNVSVEGLEIYPITWQTEAGTVYGGNYNPITGVLTVTLASWTLNGSESGWSYTTASSGRRFRIEVSNLTGMAGSGDASTVLSDKFVWSDSANATWGHVRIAGDYLNFTDNGSVLADKDAFITWLSNNNTQVIAPLATPVTYQLTPVEIRTLLGMNNLFSDTGDVAVEYPADTKKYVDSNERITDVQINGTSITNNGVANVPIADSTNLGVVKITAYGSESGLQKNSVGTISIANANVNLIKAGANTYTPIVPSNQHNSVFYGLAKASGDTSQSSSANAVGVYTETALSKISDMLNAPVSVSGSTPSITAKSGVRYICGECSTLSITAPASGCIDVVFESGSTPTVLTISSAKTGVSAIKWANGFDPSALDANTTYEINILDGEFGVVGSWT